ncbi:MAG: glucosamine-6-phosphate deaminase [Candidatus Bipolaricaulota bacterium]|nr:glucosamine-6-phosphate deaminase [Candidatus Bipolaricaulota bacterium]
MKIIIKEDYGEMSSGAANIIARQIMREPESVLGLPTGRTPVGTYAQLVNYYDNDLLDFAEITTFNLDEYYNLPRDHEESFHSYMKKRLFSKVNLKDENTNIPDGEAVNPERECQRYEESIEEAGGINLIVLGVGINGHIGFNEPGADWGSKTRLVDLAESTTRQNFERMEEAPDEALTMGIRTIMHSEKVLLLASGDEKKRALEEVLRGPVDQNWPGSILQLHPNLTVIMDKEATPEELED